MRVVIVESDTSDIDAGMRPELLTWASGIGLDANRASPRFVLTENPAGWWDAHFTIKRERDGHDYVLPGTNRVAVDYGAKVLVAPMNDWPRWFGEPDEVPDMPIPALLEVLDVAADARLRLRVAARQRKWMESR